MEAQGYTVKDNMVFQDNTSAISLSKNGKSSRTKRMKYINIRYFFVTDKLNKEEILMEWCPMGSMTADYMTKLLQGPLVQCFHDMIMGINSKDHRDQTGTRADCNLVQR